MPKRSLLWVALGLVLLAAGPASATTFTLDSGAVTIKLKQGSTTLASVGPFALNGPTDFVDFSTSPVAINDFQLSALNLTDMTIIQLAGGGVLAGLWGWSSIDVDVVATPGAGYTSSGAENPPGSGVFDISGTNVDLTGTVTVQFWDKSKSVSATLSFPTYTATAFLTSTMLTLDNVKLGGISLLDEGGNLHSIDIVADISFIGTAVPEPAMLGLLAVGGLLAAARARGGRLAKAA